MVASDSNAIECSAVRRICLAASFRRPPWPGIEAEFAYDLQLRFAAALFGLPVEGTADRKGW